MHFCPNPTSHRQAPLQAKSETSGKWIFPPTFFRPSKIYRYFQRGYVVKQCTMRHTIEVKRREKFSDRTEQTGRRKTSCYHDKIHHKTSNNNNTKFIKRRNAIRRLQRHTQSTCQPVKTKHISLRRVLAGKFHELLKEKFATESQKDSSSDKFHDTTSPPVWEKLQNINTMQLVKNYQIIHNFHH